MKIDMEYLSRMITEYTPKVVGAILTLIIGFWIIARITAVIRKSMEKRNMDPSVRSFLSSLISVGLKILLLLSVAGMFGINTTSFVAIFSAIAFAVGLALQGNLGHLASGILILVFRPYRVGDFIVTQGYSGTVKSIQIFNTILTTLDNRIIIIPNGAILSGPIENLTSPGQRIVDLTFGIGYGDNIDKARSVIEQVIKAAPGVLHDREHQIWVKNLGESSVDFAVRVWVNVDDYWQVYFHLTEYIKKAFDSQGVSIPFPQMDVHVKQN